MQKIIEEKKRLSLSVLWKLQSLAYCQFGPQAWTEKGVPFYLTSNPFTARQYAFMAAAFLRDCLSPDSPTKLDKDQPVYVLDLGAGTGRFGYLFLRQLNELLRVKSLQGIRICYVMTDISEKNLHYLREHPYLQPYIKEGMLDFAYYDCNENFPLQLMLQETTLNESTLRNPTVLIANYFFDTIPQDLFIVKDGKLLEGQVTLAAEDCDVNYDNPEIINYLTPQYSYIPVDHPEDYYPSFPEANAILSFYSERFESTPFLLPIGAFRVLDFFKKLTNKRLLLLAGDQGVSTEQQIKTWGEPKISLHGTFSIAVSYHALAAYFKQQGGFCMLTTLPDPAFAVITGGFGGVLQDYPETKTAFRIHINQFEPKDYWNLINYSEEEWRNPSLEYLLLLLKLGNWDPMNLNCFFTYIRNRIPTATIKEQNELKLAIESTWSNFYPVSPEEGDFLLNLGVLLFELKQYEQAKIFFERSIAISGEREDARKNIQACQNALIEIKR